MNHTMKELLDSEKPYEKCLFKGAEYLTDAELLAVIMRTGSNGVTSVELAREVLRQAGKDEGLLGLYQMSIASLMQIKGIGKVKAVQLKCIAELSRRIAKATAGEGRYFHDAAAIADYYMEDFRHCQEEKILLLMFNTKCKLLAEKVVSSGTVNQSVITPREIFLEALDQHAVNIILLHNHPSGDPAPSKADIAFTDQVKEVGKLVGIELLDHIIIGDMRYISFSEEGILY